MKEPSKSVNERLIFTYNLKKYSIFIDMHFRFLLLGAWT